MLLHLLLELHGAVVPLVRQVIGLGQLLPQVALHSRASGFRRVRSAEGTASSFLVVARGFQLFKLVTSHVSFPPKHGSLRSVGGRFQREMSVLVGELLILVLQLGDLPGIFGTDFSDRRLPFAVDEPHTFPLSILVQEGRLRPMVPEVAQGSDVLWGAHMMVFSQVREVMIARGTPSRVHQDV
jgi:hypothetical protein